MLKLKKNAEIFFNNNLGEDREWRDVGEGYLILSYYTIFYFRLKLLHRRKDGNKNRL